MADDIQALPPYRRIAARIKAQIDQGELRPGERIPSVRDLIRTQGVSNATAVRVAAVLRAEGYARSVPGVGSIVTLPRTLTTGPDRLVMLRAHGDGLKPGERTQVLAAELTPAPSHVADALQVEAGAAVIRRQRTYTDADGVVAVSTSWLPGEFADRAPELLDAAPLPAMTFGLVEERTGRRAVKRRDVVALKSVPAELAECLGVPAATPALTMTNTYWDQQGEVIEFAEDFLGAGREFTADHDLDSGLNHHHDHDHEA